jgi:hypothetical protein
MTEPNLEKCRQEMEDLRLLPPVVIEIPLLAAMEIVGYIQLATKNPIVGDSEFGRMAIDVARQLQNSLDPNSECFKLLEFGWEIQADLRQIEFGGEPQVRSRQVQELQQKIFNLLGVENINTVSTILKNEMVDVET